MRKIISMTCISLLALPMALAQTAMVFLEDSYELDPDLVTLPRLDSGQVSFRECRTCDSISLRVDHNTNYHIGIDTPGVTRADLYEAASGDDARGIYVFFEPESQLATRIVLSTGRQ